MRFRNFLLTTAFSSIPIVTALTVNGSDWVSTPAPTPVAKSAVSPASFLQPVSVPEFDPDPGEISEAPLLPPPQPADEQSNPSAADEAVEPTSSTTAPAFESIPDFAPDEAVRPEPAHGLKSETPDRVDSDRSPPPDSEPDTSQLKQLEGDEGTNLTPAEWFGRWNESSFEWILPGGSHGIGFFSITGDTPSWNFDLDADKEGLEIDFGTAIHFVDGPGHSGSDLPPRLFDLFWNSRFKAESDYGFGIEADFKMGLFTDFEDSVREGWRFPGRVLGYADVGNAPESGRIVAGIEYLDLEQTEILPAGGVIFEPNPDTQIDLYFPRPQIRFRVEQDEAKDQWLYFRGEYHGSAWAIERTTGQADVVSLTEYRATIGVESIPIDLEESSSFLEISFLFNRDLEYRSGIGNFQPDDTVMIRLGRRY